MLSRYHLELFFAGVVFLVGAGALHGSMELDTGWAADGPQAGFFPFRVALVLMVASVLVALQAWRTRAVLGRVPVVDREGGARVLWFGLPILAIAAAAQWLGLYVAMALYLLFAVRVRGRRPWATSLGVALGVTVAIFAVFERWFSVPLLKGPLERLLGLG